MKGNPNKMALKRVDEFDGTSEAEVVGFSVEGVNYEIDLSAANRQALYQALDRFIASARRQGGAKKTVPAKRTPAQQSPARAAGKAEQLQAIRDWAKREGFEVSDRGRIRKEIVDEFNAAHGTAPQFSAAG